MRNTLVPILKWAWIACVLLAAGTLIIRSRDDIAVMLQSVSPVLLAVSVILTVAAKGFLAENARIAAARNDIPLDFMTSARLYNLSQLGKYLPGSIWQFVGRAAAYRDRGASYGSIRDALLVESLWIVAGASLIGLMLTGPVIVDVVVRSLSPALALWLGVATSVAIAASAVLLVWKRRLARHYACQAMPSGNVVLAQACIWALLGLAFWVLARACDVDISPVFATGLFAAAYATGFLIPFAPAGLGVRDAILTLGLLPHVPAGEAVVITILARMVYLVVDVGLVVAQESILAIFGNKADTT